MRTTHLLISLLITAACSRSKNDPVPKQGSEHVESFDAELATQELARLFAAGEFARATERFGVTLKSGLPASELEEIWQRLLRGGAFKNVGDSRTTNEAGVKVVRLTLQFEQAEIDLKVAWDSSGNATGLFFVPTKKKLSDEPPPYANRDTFSEVEIVVGQEEWRLPGTVTLPVGTGPFPAVVLVHGSGPHDRDETIGANRPFRDLAWGLATRGVAVVRYDKRTLTHGTRMPPTFTVQQETIHDAIAAAELLRKTDRVAANRIFVVGHSLGALVAPRIGIADPRLAGLVLLAGSTRPIRDILLTQYAYLSALDGTVTPEEKQKSDELKAELAKLDEPTTADDVVVMGAPVSYWRDLLPYDPVAEATKLKYSPFLIIHGGRDYQVTDEDFAGWSKLKSRSNVTLLRIPELNHLLIAGSGVANPDEYNVPGHVDVRVLDAIESFVKR